MIWLAHGSRRPVMHLTQQWRNSMASDWKHDPVCGQSDTDETVQRPDGHEYCRRCISREGA